MLSNEQVAVVCLVPVFILIVCWFRIKKGKDYWEEPFRDYLGGRPRLEQPEPYTNFQRVMSDRFLECAGKVYFDIQPKMTFEEYVNYHRRI